MDVKKPSLAPSLSRDDFEAAAEFAFAAAVKILEKWGTVPSLLFAGHKVGDALEMAFVDDVALETDADRWRLSAVMEALVRAPEVDVVMHVTEAWVLITDQRYIPEGSIEHHPQRGEAVVFNIRSKDCQTIVNNPLRRDPVRLERGEVDLLVELAGKLARKNPVRH